MMNARYLIVTTTISDQRMSDTTPSTFAFVGGTPCSRPKHSCIE
jgi:hypothetical protein